MSEPQISIMTPAVATEYIKGLHLMVTRLIETVKRLVGEEAFEKAEKAVEQAMKEDQIRAQNQDPRVEALAQTVTSLQHAVESMPKVMAREFASIMAQQQQRSMGPYMAPAPVSLDPTLVPPSEDGSHTDDGEDDEQDPPRSRKPGKRGGLPNTTKARTLEHDRISRASAPGGVPAPLGPQQHADDGDDGGIDDGSH